MINQLSVFFPAYNEEGNIEKVVEDTKQTLLKVVEQWEIIIVNDGSKDKTIEIAEKLAQIDDRIKVVNHQMNRGYGGALKSGFSNSKYNWVAFTDSDGQFDFSEITKFLEKTKEADVILGYRIKRADSLIRAIYSFVWTVMMPRLLFRLNVRDYSCGFKMIKKEVFDAVEPLVGEEKVTQIELLVKAQRKGFKFAEIGVHHYPREKGRPTGANAKVVLKSFISLVKLFRELK